MTLGRPLCLTGSSRKFSYFSVTLYSGPRPQFLRMNILAQITDSQAMAERRSISVRIQRDRSKNKRPRQLEDGLKLVLF